MREEEEEPGAKQQWHLKVRMRNGRSLLESRRPLADRTPSTE